MSASVALPWAGLSSNRKRSGASPRQSSPPRSGSRRRKSPPAPEAAWPEAHPSTTSRQPSPSAHQNQPEAERAWRTSCARHLESDTCRFGNPPSESRLLSFGIRPQSREGRRKQRLRQFGRLEKRQNRTVRQANRLRRHSNRHPVAALKQLPRDGRDGKSRRTAILECGPSPRFPKRDVVQLGPEPKERGAAFRRRASLTMRSEQN